MPTTIDGSAGITTNAGGSVNPSTNIDGINYSCRAWVNFNGTGTVAIRSSGNVSSITDNGTGDYTVNFATAMSDANYSAVALVDNAGSNFGSVIVAASQTSTFTTASIRILSRNAGASASPSDSVTVCVSIFR